MVKLIDLVINQKLVEEQIKSSIARASTNEDNIGYAILAEDDNHYFVKYNSHTRTVLYILNINYISEVHLDGSSIYFFNTKVNRVNHTLITEHKMAIYTALKHLTKKNVF